MKLIQTKDPNFLLLIDENSVIKTNDYRIDYYENGNPANIRKVIKVKNDKIFDGDLTYNTKESVHKIIASYPEIEGLILLPSPCKEEVDIEKLAKEKFPLPYKIHNRGIQNHTYKGRNPYKGLKKWNRAFVEGYKANNKQFTLADLEAAMSLGITCERYKDDKNGGTLQENFEGFVQSLSSTALPIEFIPETYSGCECNGLGAIGCNYENNKNNPLSKQTKCLIQTKLKTITKDTKIYLVGEYKY